MIRILLFLIVSVLIVITLGGFVAVKLNLLSTEVTKLYNENFSFITGIASVVGLFALASSKKIISTDFENEELEKLQKVMKVASELEKIEKDKSKTEKDLLDLKKRKKIMEVSVEKAGLVLFYKDQQQRYQNLVLERLKNDDELRNGVNEIIESKEKLRILNEEIAKDDNVGVILAILENQNRNSKWRKDDPVYNLFLKLSYSLNKFFRFY